MSMSQDHLGLKTKLPLERIHELCRGYGVSELSVCSVDGDEQSESSDEILFLVMFHDDDFGPWGSKLDELENDLSGVMHRKVHVASRRGIEQSSDPLRKARIFGSATRIL
jgi:predicted nucleotidyltransferase